MSMYFNPMQQFSISAGARLGGLSQMQASVGSYLQTPIFQGGFPSLCGGYGLSGSFGYSGGACAGYSPGASVGYGMSSSCGYGASGAYGYGTSSGCGYGPSGSFGYGVSSSCGYGPSGSYGYGVSSGCGYSPSGSYGYGVSGNYGYSPSCGLGYNPSGSYGYTPSCGLGYTPSCGIGYSPSCSPGYRPGCGMGYSVSGCGVGYSPSMCGPGFGSTFGAMGGMGMGGMMGLMGMGQMMPGMGAMGGFSPFSFSPFASMGMSLGSQMMPLIGGGVPMWSGPSAPNYRFPSSGYMQPTFAPGASSAGISNVNTSNIRVAGWGREMASFASRNANGPGGYCYRWVKKSLRRHGVHCTGGSAYMAANQLAQNPRFKEVRGMSFSQIKRLPPGCVVVWDRGPRGAHGHIAISLGNGREASDKIRNFVNKGSRCRVFIPR